MSAWLLARASLTSATVVTCVDVDAERIAKLNEGVIPIYEPGLYDLVARNYKRKRLRFTTDLAEGVKDADGHLHRRWNSAR